MRAETALWDSTGRREITEGRPNEYRWKECTTYRVSTVIYIYRLSSVEVWISIE